MGHRGDTSPIRIQYSQQAADHFVGEVGRSLYSSKIIMVRWWTLARDLVYDLFHPDYQTVLTPVEH